MKLNEFVNNMADTTPTQPEYLNKLSPSAAKKGFVFDSPSTIVTRRKDRQDLAKTKDLSIVKQDLELCFERMLTAFSSTQLQGVATNKINQLRSQLYSLIDSKLKQVK